MVPFHDPLDDAHQTVPRSVDAPVTLAGYHYGRRVSGTRFVTALTIRNRVARSLAHRFDSHDILLTPRPFNGARRGVLTRADGLSPPTPVAIRGTQVRVPSAAYTTRSDPNLLSGRRTRALPELGT